MLEEVVRKGANGGRYSLLPTGSKVLKEKKLGLAIAVCKQR